MVSPECVNVTFVCIYCMDRSRTSRPRALDCRKVTGSPYGWLGKRANSREKDNRNLRSALELQAKNEEWQMPAPYIRVCGVSDSGHDDIRSLSSLSTGGLGRTCSISGIES